MDFDDLDELEEAAAVAADPEPRVDGDVPSLRVALRPLPEKQCVDVPLPGREVSSATEATPIDQIEQRVANAISQGALRSTQAALKDLMPCATSPESRRRVVHFLAEQVKEAATKGVKTVTNEVCWQLCSMAFSLSGQDIDFYPGEESGPVVLVAGNAGSSIDDFRPVAERWATHYGAAVAILSPSTDWMAPQQKALYNKVISLMSEGRPLIIHSFSNGGMQPSANFLLRWLQDMKSKKEGIPPIECFKCWILDSIAVGNFSEPGRVNTYADIGWGPAPTWEEQVDKLFKSLGLAMLLYHGVIQTTASELGMVWGKAVYDCVQSGMVKQGMKRFAWTCESHLSPFWERVPCLFVASSSDSIVAWGATKWMAGELGKLAPRKENFAAAHPGASKDVVGEDGLGIHTQWFKEEVFVPVAHAKHFKNHPNEYWYAVDRLACACLGLSTSDEPK